MLNALLLQVDPGYDIETVEEIMRKFGKNINVFIGFGRYDLIVVSEETDFELIRKFHEIGLDHVHDWYAVWGLRWAVDKKRDAKLQGKRAVLGLSFIKIDVDRAIKANMNPVKLEEEIVQSIRSKIPCAIYSSLGFNELVVATQSKSFKELAKKVVLLKKCLIRDKSPVVLDISTVPALEYCTLEEEDFEERLKEKLSVRVLLSLRVGLSLPFKKKLEKLVGDAGISIFGFHDVLLTLEGTAGEVVKKLRIIREEGKQQGLYSSFTIIPHPDEALDFIVPETSSQKGVASVSRRGNADEQISFYKTWFQASRRDLTTKHIFEDHVAFFSGDMNLPTTFQIEKDLDADENYFRAQVLDSLRECLRVGFEQRCSGISPGNLLGPKSIRTEPLGGIQRATMAIESIPNFLFKNLDLGNWPGFCIHGYASRFYRTESGIINIPQQFRLNPEMWWGVFHETGHAVFSDIEKKTKSKITEEIELLADVVIRKNRARDELDRQIIEEDYMAFADEIFSEIFGFHFGFNDEWKLYIKKVWSYFSKELKLDYQHLSRSILVYFTLGPGKKLSRDQITVEEIDKCIRQIEKITKKENGRSIDEEEWDSAITIVWAFLATADVVKSYLQTKPNFYDKSKIRQTGNVLKKGQISYCHNPLEILFSLVNAPGEHNCKHRLATILSLYDCYCENLGKKLEEGKQSE
jgi:hypothetical protein